MTKFVDTYFDGLANLPPWAQAFLIGWAFSIGVTQGLKFVFPVWMPVGWREAVNRLIAFLTAALPAGLWMLAAEASPLACWLMAISTGTWSPIAYAMLIAGLRRFPKLAWIADVLSGDKRGVIAEKLKERADGVPGSDR